MEHEADSARPGAKRSAEGGSEKKAQQQAAKRLRRQEKQKRKHQGENQHKGSGAKPQGIGNLRTEAQAVKYYTDDNGFRQVPPYVHEFQTFAKDRWLRRSVDDVYTAEFAAETRLWLGRSVEDVYTAEFAAETSAYYAAAVAGGRITVNGAIVPRDYRVEAGDLLSHRVHRHELPAAGGAVEVVAETDEVLVANKPAGLPVHPCGAYRYNTLVCVLAHQRPALPQLHICHRLDRLTSGIVILAKSAQKAAAVCARVRSASAQKTYLARVKGRFGVAFPPALCWDGQGDAPPAYWRKHARHDSNGGGGGDGSGDGSGSSGGGQDGAVGSSSTGAGGGDSSNGNGCKVDGCSANAGGGGDGRSSGAGAPAGDSSGGGGSGQSALSIDTEEVEVCAPVRVVSYRASTYACGGGGADGGAGGGKSAVTRVRALRYDAASDTTLVACAPREGRTHQLRLHLRWLGHPIANDPCYGGALFCADAAGRARAEAARAWLRRRGCPCPADTGAEPEEEAADGGGGVRGGTDAGSGGGGDAGAASNGSGETDTSGGSADVHGDSAGADAAEARLLQVLRAGYREGESEESFVRRTCRHCFGRSAPAGSTGGATTEAAAMQASAQSGASTKDVAAAATTAHDESMTKRSAGEDAAAEAQAGGGSGSAAALPTAVLPDSPRAAAGVPLPLVAAAVSGAPPVDAAADECECSSGSGSGGSSSGGGVDKDFDYAMEMSMQALTRSPGIWLHALRYSDEGWSYETAPPKWATETGWGGVEPQEVKQEALRPPRKGNGGNAGSCGFEEEFKLLKKKQAPSAAPAAPQAKPKPANAMAPQDGDRVEKAMKFVIHKKTKPPAEPRPPTNGFFKYAELMRPIITKICDDASDPDVKVNQTQVSKIASLMWKELTEDQKRAYKAVAKADWDVKQAKAAAK
ncbi:hypothetical protein JKP88DRAFT_352509 [Tribonema minus]|uniref:HMG box domain-containing protein n=1 Tax=Tribonema minus TaxID=303371 RepID=A0A835ZEQ1_9STRA|nr:hypothetical protein JKP88DRAFT_352509 [Tribonema minus]